MEKVIKFNQEVLFGQFHEIFKEVLKEKYDVVAKNQNERIRLYRKGISATDFIQIRTAVEKFLKKEPFWSPFSYVILSEEARVINYLSVPKGSISLKTSAKQRYHHYHCLPKKMKIDGVLISIPYRSDDSESSTFLEAFVKELLNEVKKRLDSARGLSTLVDAPQVLLGEFLFMGKCSGISYIYINTLSNVFYLLLK